MDVSTYHMQGIVIYYNICAGKQNYIIHLDSQAMIDSAASSNELGALHHIIFDVILPLVDAVTHPAIKYYVGSISRSLRPAEAAHCLSSFRMATKSS